MSRVLAALLGLVLLAGCGGEPDPAGQGVGQPSPTSDETGFMIPVPSAPPVPRRPATGHAEEFAVHFLTDELPYVINSGFTTQYRRRTSLHCKGCRQVLAEIERWHERGAPEVTRPTVRVVRSTRLEYPSEYWEVFRVRVVATFHRVDLNPDSGPSRVIRGGPQVHVLVVTANWRLGWQVAGWGVPQPKDDGSTLV